MKIGSAILFLWIMVSTSCRERTTDVPYVQIDLWININEPQWFNLLVPSGWEYTTGGSRGMIIYRNNLEEFTVLERHSPYNAQDACAAIVTNDNVIVEDPCSNSQWLIIDGSVVTGPTTFPLVQYDATFTDPYLHIFN